VVLTVAPNTHSEFGASSTARLLTCAGSYRMMQKARKAKLYTGGSKIPSVYADEGTAAHLLAEMCLASGKAPHDFIGQKITLNHRPAQPFAIDFDFAEAVAVYVDWVRGLQAVGYQVELEQTVEPAWAWTGDVHQPQDASLPFDLFGTSDCVATLKVSQTEGVLVIGDLKFGRGILVEVKDNAQLKYYALGALRLAELKLAGIKFETVTTVIVQPRASHPDGPTRVHTYARQELIDWGRNVLKPGIDRALLPNQPLTAGEHCRFCPAVLACPEMKKKTLEAARKAFAGTPLPNTDLDTMIQAGAPTDEELDKLSLADLDELYQYVQVADLFSTRVKEHLKDRLSQATSSEVSALQHVKPVRTAPREVWVADKTAADFAQAVISENITRVTSEVVPSLSLDKHAQKTPKQVRRLLKEQGKDPALFDAFVTTIPGNATIAPKSDPRPVHLPNDPDAGLDDLMD
jgi:hypothetical protein